MTRRRLRRKGELQKARLVALWSPGRRTGITVSGILLAVHCTLAADLRIAVSRDAVAFLSDSLVIDASGRTNAITSEDSGSQYSVIFDVYPVGRRQCRIESHWTVDAEAVAEPVGTSRCHSPIRFTYLDYQLTVLERGRL